VYTEYEIKLRRSLETKEITLVSLVACAGTGTVTYVVMVGKFQYLPILYGFLAIHTKIFARNPNKQMQQQAGNLTYCYYYDKIAKFIIISTNLPRVILFIETNEYAKSQNILKTKNYYFLG